MLRISTLRDRRLCQGVSRSHILRASTASMLGLPDLVHTAELKANAKSLTLFFLERGPAAQDLRDTKLDAPEIARGEFKPIATTVPGLYFCEHLPRLAEQAHDLTLVRSIHHTINDQNAGAHFGHTGRDTSTGRKLITTPRPGNFPPIGQ